MEKNEKKFATNRCSSIRQLENILLPDKLLLREQTTNTLPFAIQSLLDNHRSKQYIVSILNNHKKNLFKIYDRENDKQWIIRFNQIENNLFINKKSANYALTKLSLLTRFSLPLFLNIGKSDGQYRPTIEGIEFYPAGNLSCQWQQQYLRYQNKDISQQIRSIACELLFFYHSLKSLGLWHINIKPSQFIMNNAGQLVVANSQGLIMHDKDIINHNAIHTTVMYHDSSVYYKNNILLERLTKQCIASSVYQLLTNQCPDHIVLGNQNDALKFSFHHRSFNTQNGKMLQTLIIDLLQAGTFNTKYWLKKLHQRKIKQGSKQPQKITQ